MKTSTSRLASRAAVIRKAAYLCVAATLSALTSSPAYAEVSQTPLYLGGGNVPGNLLLVPSVEWPTIVSVANLGSYDPTTTYIGYFDPNKCYGYSYSSTESERHFYPTGAATSHLCVNGWSGNFMNWAATQTIDPFRKVLTGGYRFRDTPTETWLEKARHTGQGGTNIYPNRRLNSRTLVRGSTPFDADEIDIRIEGLGNRMRLTMEEHGDGDNVTDVYDFAVRVEVCVPGKLEANCRAYGSGYKPEGLIQQYANELRIGILGFLNDPDMLRDGGVLRARQGFVGPTMVVPGTGETTNPNTEWDPDTGVFVRNPHPDDASATAAALGIPINDSGAINYLNKFGQLTSNNHKDHDPVSELFYTALRYLKNQGNVPQYSAIPGNTGVNATRAADSFPVITDWDDPIQYACQKNVILGIGDVYTHRDKNLPGSGNGSEEPPTPAAVTSDDTVDVAAAISQVAQLEGVSLNTPFNNGGNRNNSAFIAGLAWDAHTRDIRTDPDMPGDQTVSTHWVDVLEAQTLERPAENQYYLAAKYGGFRVPDDFDPDTHTGSLDLDWWHSNGEMLDSFGNGTPGAPFPRPDNYYLAGGAHQMVESLTQAFARISKETRSSASSVAANSTRLDADTAVFQAAFDSTRWSGEVRAFSIDENNGTISNDDTWNAAERLDELSEFSLSSRKIFTAAPPEPAGGVSTTGLEFTWTGLATEQKEALRKQPGSATLEAETVGQNRLAYLRGSRTGEQPDGDMRERDSRLGDIVNSDPQFVHNQDFGYALLDQSEAFAGDGAGEAYRTFRQSVQGRTPMVIVGANDGMLHGFDATLSPTIGGTELFAFVPDSVFENLYELTLPEYAHRFYVDGSPRVADVLIDGSWRTIVVGTTGAGGKSVFALDITDPSAMSTDNVLWEFTHPSMGYTIGQAAVAPLPNGEFGVVVTSGYETGQDGIVWVLDPADGSIIKSFTLPNSRNLGSPLVTDLNSDRVADRLYVGDTEGNLWRLDFDGSSTSTWGPPNDLKSGNTPVPLFVARDSSGSRRPITAPLTSAFNDKGLHMIFFGTGTFYRVDDNVVLDPPDIDTFYGVIDRGEPIVRADLLEQVILAEATVGGMDVRGVSENELQSGHSGWFLDLAWRSSFGGTGPEGERVVSRATVRGDRVIFATVIPNPDPCDSGGESWLMELNTFTGGRLPYAVFDVNADGVFDEDDWITVTVDGENIRIPPSAMNPDIGIIKTPAVIGGVGDDNDEVKILSGSSGKLIRVSERGGVGIGRQSWRQLR